MNSIALDFAALVAVAVALIHLAAPRVREFLAERRATLGALGSGMAVGYVFIHLLKELDAGEEFLGNGAHIVMLLGFLAYYWVEGRMMAKGPGEREGSAARAGYDPRLAFGWAYGWLLLYTLPAAVQGNGLLLLAPLLGVCIHLLYEDFHQGSENVDRFDSRDRFILATGPIAGWLTDLFVFGDDVVVSSLLTAFLAGSVLYKVFGREIPRNRNVNIAWFGAGVIFFSALDGLGRL